AARYGGRPCMRYVGEQRAERHDHLDAELASEADDPLAERAPPEIRLDAEEEHRIAIRTGDATVVEGVLRPVDAPRQPVDERDVGPRCLEVVEALGVQVGEALGVPHLREVAR